MIRRTTDFQTPDSMEGIEVYQLTSNPDLPGTHLYMEAQIFTPDSKRFLLHTGSDPHGYDTKNPDHKYYLCDLESDGELTPMLTELGVAAPSISPDGKYIYYFVDHTEPGHKGSLAVKRMNIDGTDPRTIVVMDKTFHGTPFRPSNIYPLSTISADGKRLAISAFLGDGSARLAVTGLIVCDLEKGTAEVVTYGEDWINMHPQYCRSSHPDHVHDVMIQQNHGGSSDEWGAQVKQQGGLGADIHLIRDDGTNFRDFPWGRDGSERCQGHQCWQGRSEVAISTMGGGAMVRGVAGAHENHKGKLMQQGWRNELTAAGHFDFWHFATDVTGRWLVSDSKDTNGLYLAKLPDPENRNPDTRFESLQLITYSKSSWGKKAHPHPFLSPDSKKVFFNSDESGILQAYMAVLPG